MSKSKATLPPDRDRCEFPKRNGEPCKNPAGAGTDHTGYGLCKLHGGNTPSGRKSAQTQMQKDLVHRYGAPVEVGPKEALLQELARTAGHVAFLEEKVHSIEEGKISYDVFGNKVPDFFLDWYRKERAHLKEVARDCARAGVEERQIELMEEQGRMLAEKVRGLLDDLGIDLANAKVQELIRKWL